MRRQPDFSTSPRRRRGPAWQGAALGVGAAALVFSAAGAWKARAEALSARSRLAEVRREVEAAAARVRGLEARTLGHSRGLAAADAPPSRIVADLADAIPEGVRLEGLQIDYARGGALEIDVVARDAAAWDRLLARLEGAPRLRDVQPGPEAREGEVRTIVRARWVGGGP